MDDPGVFLEFSVKSFHGVARDRECVFNYWIGKLVKYGCVFASDL